ncbi:hypothetical protein [Methylophilus sp. TWE2]|uniref:hypothetical protein n=1 Tax=Methylophilus sp. TWE2 TaxID=1662285 RepID=UPI0006711F4D|nr:hypothetical protein [Methylophilus sp. TWE2]AKR43339.1 hypothetical protein ACJ67_07790 [Methylophilus sp. TWE2]
MKQTLKTALTIAALSTLSVSAFAAEVCTVSMMGRVCYEEGSAELTSSHMKGDAVAEANAAKKKVEVADASKAKK